MMINKRNLQQIDVIIDKKQDELIALNQEKQNLQENMSDPRCISDVACKMEEKGREIAISLEARDYILARETVSVRRVFEVLKQDCVTIIENRRFLSISSVEEEKNLASINNIIASKDTNDPNLPSSLGEGQQSSSDTNYPDPGDFDE